MTENCDSLLRQSATARLERFERALEGLRGLIRDAGGAGVDDLAEVIGMVHDLETQLGVATAAIKTAPHGIHCAVASPDVLGSCNCWKRAALRAVEART